MIITMPYIIAVERDMKCASDIGESLKDVAQELGHELLIFTTLSEMRATLAKPENQSKALALALLPYEDLHADPKVDISKILTTLKAELKCEILLTAFDDPLKPLKPKNWPVNNILYKPFDLTILKEHSCFALNEGKKTKTKFVHNAQIESEVEIIKKFQILELSEFAFKIDKSYPLKLGQAYKFYHPLFEHKKNNTTKTHTWARVACETAAHYELFFCQNIAAVLSQVRKRVASSSQKIKNPSWSRPSVEIFPQSSQKSLNIALELIDETIKTAIQSTLSRNFKNINFIELPPPVVDSKTNVTRASSEKPPSQIDLLVTEAEYENSGLESRFGNNKPIVVRLSDEKLERDKLEKRFNVEHIRCELHADRAHIVKLMHAFFPLLEHGEEEIVMLSTALDESISLSELSKAKEFSEAAISLASPNKFNLGQLVELALPQADESNLKEIKARVHFIEANPTAGPGLYNAQFVLFGVRDEVLKELRLWTLHQHIEKNKKSS